MEFRMMKFIICIMIVGIMVLSAFNPVIRVDSQQEVIDESDYFEISNLKTDESHLAADEQMNLEDTREYEMIFPSDQNAIQMNNIVPNEPFAGESDIEDLHHISEVWDYGYHGENVTLALVDTGIDFGHMDLQGTQAVVTNATSPYYGWPVAFDPRSMRTFLQNNDTAGTWYANTSRTGTGPFALTHNIEIDGTNDFGEQSEKFGNDPRNADSSIVDGGNKYDFDLTDVYVTRDDNYWYLGIPTYPQRAPGSYGLYDYPSFGVYIDVDNETSGTATVDPFGNYVNTLTSHSDEVLDVKYSPDGTMVASASMDKVIKIWDTSTGMVLDTLLGHTGIPRSLDWTPDSTKLISTDVSPNPATFRSADTGL